MKRLLKVFFIPYYLFFFIFSCNDTKNTKYRNKFDNEFSPEKLQNNITPQSDISRLSRRQRINKNKILQKIINERIKNHIEILKNVENSKNIDDFVKNINYLNESLYTLGTDEQENIIEKLRNIIELNYINDRDGSVSFFLTKNIKIHQVGNSIDNFFNYCRLIISLRQILKDKIFKIDFKRTKPLFNVNDLVEHDYAYCLKKLDHDYFENGFLFVIQEKEATIKSGWGDGNIIDKDLYKYAFKNLNKIYTLNPNLLFGFDIKKVVIKKLNNNNGYLYADLEYGSFFIDGILFDDVKWFVPFNDLKISFYQDSKDIYTSNVSFGCETNYLGLFFPRKPYLIETDLSSLMDFITNMNILRLLSCECPNLKIKNRLEFEFFPKGWILFKKQHKKNVTCNFINADIANTHSAILGLKLLVDLDMVSYTGKKLKIVKNDGAYEIQVGDLRFCKEGFFLNNTELKKQDKEFSERKNIDAIVEILNIISCITKSSCVFSRYDLFHVQCGKKKIKMIKDDKPQNDYDTAVVLSDDTISSSYSLDDDSEYLELSNIW